MASFLTQRPANNLDADHALIASALSYTSSTPSTPSLRRAVLDWTQTTLIRSLTYHTRGLKRPRLDAPPRHLPLFDSRYYTLLASTLSSHLHGPSSAPPVLDTALLSVIETALSALATPLPKHPHHKPLRDLSLEQRAHFYTQLAHLLFKRLLAPPLLASFRPNTNALMHVLGTSLNHLLLHASSSSSSSSSSSTTTTNPLTLAVTDFSRLLVDFLAAHLPLLPNQRKLFTTAISPDILGLILPLRTAHPHLDTLTTAILLHPDHLADMALAIPADLLESTTPTPASKRRRTTTTSSSSSLPSSYHSKLFAYLRSHDSPEHVLDFLPAFYHAFVSAYRDTHHTTHSAAARGKRKATDASTDTRAFAIEFSMAQLLLDIAHERADHSPYAALAVRILNTILRLDVYKLSEDSITSSKQHFLSRLLHDQLMPSMNPDVLRAATAILQINHRAAEPHIDDLLLHCWHTADPHPAHLAFQQQLVLTYANIRQLPDLIQRLQDRAHFRAHNAHRRLADTWYACFRALPVAQQPTLWRTLLAKATQARPFLDLLSLFVDALHGINDHTAAKLLPCIHETVDALLATPSADADLARLAIALAYAHARCSDDPCSILTDFTRDIDWWHNLKDRFVAHVLLLEQLHLLGSKGARRLKDVLTHIRDHADSLCEPTLVWDGTAHTVTDANYPLAVWTLLTRRIALVAAHASDSLFDLLIDVLVTVSLHPDSAMARAAQHVWHDATFYELGGLGVPLAKHLWTRLVDHAAQGNSRVHKRIHKDLPWKRIKLPAQSSHTQATLWRLVHLVPVDAFLPPQQHVGIRICSILVQNDACQAHALTWMDTLLAQHPHLAQHAADLSLVNYLVRCDAPHTLLATIARHFIDHNLFDEFAQAVLAKHGHLWPLALQQLLAAAPTSSDCCPIVEEAMDAWRAADSSAHMRTLALAMQFQRACKRNVHSSDSPLSLMRLCAAHADWDGALDMAAALAHLLDVPHAAALVLLVMSRHDANTAPIDTLLKRVERKRDLMAQLMASLLDVLHADDWHSPIFQAAISSLHHILTHCHRLSALHAIQKCADKLFAALLSTALHTHEARMQMLDLAAALLALARIDFSYRSISLALQIMQTCTPPLRLHNEAALRDGTVPHALDIFQHLYPCMYALLRHRSDQLPTHVTTVVALTRRMLLLLVSAYNADAGALALDVPARSLTRIYHLLVADKKDKPLQKYVVYILTDLLHLITRGLISKHLRDLLQDGSYDLLTVASRFELQQLNQTLGIAARSVFQRMYRDYRANAGYRGDF